jgi:4-amino-4-deoxy-L-arabinose transferase-like glycosyltransferase
MTARTRTDVLLLAGFCAFLFFYGLGAFGLIGADEPRYAQVAREMLERHDWITPTLGGQAWLEKPPLYYWQAMLSYSVLGVTDIAARIPSAVDATLLVVSIYLFFRKFRPTVQVDAALIAATCAGTIGYARAASMDIGLAAAFTIGMLAWWAWRESGRRLYLAIFYIFMALGTLAKGPVAPFLAAVGVVLFSIATRHPKLIVGTLWWPGLLLFCVVGLPWYVAVDLRNPQFFREFILEHNLARFSTNLYHHREPFWYYVPVTALALVPWIAFVVAAFWESVRVWWSERKTVRNEPDLELQFSVFACCWLVVPVFFFSISQSKLPGYILPSVPAGAILLANYLLGHFEREQTFPQWLAILHAAVAAAPVLPAIVIGFLVFNHRLPSGRPLAFAVGVTVVLFLAIAVTLMTRARLRMLRFVTLIPVVLAVAAVLKMGTTAIDKKLSTRPLAIELGSIETQKLPIAVFGVPREVEYGLAFYRNQVVARYELGNIPRQQHLLVAPATWLDNVEKQTAGRKVSFLGHYAPQNLDYFWVGEKR